MEYIIYISVAIARIQALRWTEWRFSNMCMSYATMEGIDIMDHDVTILPPASASGNLVLVDSAMVSWVRVPKSGTTLEFGM